jgi:antitoxin CcdA
MPTPIRDSKAPRRRVNLTIDGELLQQARKLDLNLSQTLTERLGELVREERARRWQEENREAIEEFNRFVEQHGVVADRLRQF